MELNSRVADGPFWVDVSTEDRDGSSPEVVNGRIVPVVLSGGGGTRLWPFSTNETPKQFLPLFGGGKSLFRQAVDRVRDRARFCSPIVVASILHADTCGRELADEHDGAQLILEPCGRNTAPAVVMAALAASERYGDDPLLLVMPSDHLIQQLDEFYGAISKGYPAAAAGKLVTFGIQPSAPETGYGYVQMGAEMPGCPGVCAVARFVEKPSLEAAQRMLVDGNHLWNAGIFLFRASVILAEAEKFAPDMMRSARAAIAAAAKDDVRIIPDAPSFAECPSESIDYAIMEHSASVAVVPMSPGWSDLGSWDALAATLGEKNPIGPITAVDCESCYILSDGLEVAALGVRDLIIVASGGRLLIMPKGRSQEVKRLLSAMDSAAA